MHIFMNVSEQMIDRLLDETQTGDRTTTERLEKAFLHICAEAQVKVNPKTGSLRERWDASQQNRVDYIHLVKVIEDQKFPTFLDELKPDRGVPTVS